MASLRVATLMLAVAAGCGGSSDESRYATFSGSLLGLRAGPQQSHSFEARRDGVLTITLTQLTCGQYESPVIEIVARMNGVNFLSGDLRSGQSMTGNGSKGTYDIEVGLDRLLYPSGCQYTITASQ